MSPPKYHPGERVVVLPERGNSSVRPGIYTITRVMPASPDGIQYRAKNEMDTHERVLLEAQLRPASAVAPLGDGGRAARNGPLDVIRRGTGSS